MVKHTQTIRRLLLTNCLNVFDHSGGLALNELNRFIIATSEKSGLVVRTSSKSLERKTVYIADFIQYFLETSKKKDAKGSYI